jgi:hypothetical protein
VFICVHLWLIFILRTHVLFELRKRRIKVFRDFDLALKDIPRKCHASILALWRDPAHAIETFILRRRDQSVRHLSNGLLGHQTVARFIAGDASLDWNVEEEGFKFATVALCEPDVRFSFPRSQVSGIHVGFGPGGGNALTNQIANGGENAGVHRLIVRVVGDEAAEFV